MMVMNRQDRPVLLLQLGEAVDPVRQVHGGYTDWYRRAWEGDFTVHDGRQPGKAPPIRDFAALVVTGSARSLVAPEPWMDDAADLLTRAHDAGVAILGVCFGHQLIGHTFGGKVVQNPNGWEIGTMEVTISDAGRQDPLFQGLPDTIRVNLSHEDIVEGDVQVLAGNPRTRVQALAHGEHVRGIQFHPEFTGVVTRGYLEARRRLLAAKGLDVDALVADCVDCPHGVAVMRNFRRFFVERT
jgi:GMP synthase (glutamine-hydrolysing)